VSGDFYWFLEISTNATRTEFHYLMILADCTGHGVPGAFMSMIGNNLLVEITKTKQIYSPEKLLDELQHGIITSLRQHENDSHEGMDIVVTALEKTATTHVLRYAGAMNSLYYVQNEEFFEIKADKVAIGGKKNTDKPYSLHEILLTKPTTVYLCTDGYQDQFGGEHNRKFMVKRLRELLLQTATLPFNEQHAVLATTFETWKGTNDQVDDVSIWGFEV